MFPYMGQRGQFLAVVHQGQGVRVCVRARACCVEGGGGGLTGSKFCRGVELGIVLFTMFGYNHVFTDL